MVRIFSERTVSEPRTTEVDTDDFSDLDLQPARKSVGARFDEFDSRFFGTTTDRIDEDNSGTRSFDPNTYRNPTRRNRALIIAGGCALAGASVFLLVRNHFAEESRIDDIEECVSAKVGDGVEIELQTDPGSGQLIKPASIYPEIEQCEAAL